MHKCGAEKESVVSERPPAPWGGQSIRCCNVHTQELIMYLSNYCSINKWLIFLLKHFGVPPNALPI